MAEDDGGKLSVKGFAGLAGLVSDITIEPPNQARTTKTSSAKVPSVRPIGSTRTQPPPSSPQPSNRGPQAMPTNQGVPWRTFGGLAVIAVFALIAAVSQIGKSQDSAPAADASAAAVDASAAVDPTAAPSSAPSTEETAPPVGSGLQLDASQIRYCLSEKIRINAVRTLVQDEAAPELTAFNAKVDDYNARCGSFQYPDGLLSQVTTEVEQARNGIERQARTDWLRTTEGIGAGNRYETITPPPVQAPSPEFQVQAQPTASAAPQASPPESSQNTARDTPAPDANATSSPPYASL
jgi:hypothetical protein